MDMQGNPQPTDLNKKTETGALVEVDDLRRYFDVSPPFLNRVIERTEKRYVKAVDGISFKIRTGETFSLVGESGCGKSTVGHLLVGLYTPTRGRIRFNGVDIGPKIHRRIRAGIQNRMQMIFQDPYASLNPRWRVKRIVAEAIRPKNGNSRHRIIADRTNELLVQVGLSPEDGEKFPHEFSGGQRQRVSIARALAGQPDFIVCDEPTSALDVSVQAQILNLMKDLQIKLGITYLFVSHDLAVVHHISDMLGVMYLGRLVELAETHTIFTQPKHPYTRMLLESIPKLSVTGQKRTPVAGEVPSPINPPPGCTFHPRCPFAGSQCKSKRPDLLVLDGSYVACHGVAEGRI